MASQTHANFVYSTVATAPSPAASGTSLVVATGDGTKFPAGTYNCTVWPAGTQPSTTNAEIILVFARTGSADTLGGLVRAQESTSARTILVGDQIAMVPTAATFTNIENNVVRTDGTLNTASGTIGATQTTTPLVQFALDTGAATTLGAGLGTLQVSGAYDASHSIGGGVNIKGFAEELFASGHVGSRMELWTTPIGGSAIPVRRVALDSAGSLHVNPTITSSLVSAANAAFLSTGAFFCGGGLTYASNQPTAGNFSVDTSGNTSVAGTLAVTGHVTLEGVTSTGATGTGKLVFDTAPTLGATTWRLAGVNAQTANYTMVLGDASKLVTMNKSTAITLTIPANSSVAYGIGTIINFANIGAGTLTLAITTDTLTGSTSYAQNVGGFLLKTAATTWIAFKTA